MEYSSTLKGHSWAWRDSSLEQEAEAREATIGWFMLQCPGFRGPRTKVKFAVDLSTPAWLSPPQPCVGLVACLWVGDLYVYIGGKKDKT